MSEIKAVVAEDYRHVIEIRDGDTREDLFPYSSSHPKYKNGLSPLHKSDKQVLKELGILEGRRHVIARFTDRYVVDGEEITTSSREIVFHRHGYHWEEALGDSLEQYSVFYNKILERQYSGFIDNNLKKNQKVRLENFNAN